MVMKVCRWLAPCLLIAACSDGPARDQSATPAAAPEPNAAATAGEHPPAPDTAVPAEAPKPATRRAVESAEVKDARAAATGPVTMAAVQSGVNADGAILQDFNDRVKKYVEVHKDAAKGNAKLKETEDPAEITRAQDALAAKIRAARATAKQGDIFTAEIRNKFRRLLAPELKGEDGRDAKEVLKEDAPSPAQIPFKVNAKYPEGAPLPSVPANLLLNLPTLPEPIEYRIIGKHLILLDTGANIIVDFMTNAIK
jgi:hypothetical protein